MNSRLLHFVIQQSIASFNITQQSFSQIAKCFNLISQNFNPPYKTILQKFANKLFDIFQTQGPNYRDYLNLPKFGALKLSTQDQLKTLFCYIWTHYEQKLEKEKYYSLVKEIEKLVPDFKSLDEVEAFHLHLLKTFKNSMIKKQLSEDKLPYHSSMLSEYRYKRPLQQQFFIPEAHSKYSPNPFPSINNQPNQPKTKIEDVDPKYNQQFWGGDDSKYVQGSGNFPIYVKHKSPSPHQSHGFPPYIEPKRQQQVHQKPIAYEKGQKQHFSSSHGHHNNQMENLAEMETEERHHVAVNEGDLEQKMSSFLLSECVCEGICTNDESSSKPYFICKKCQFYYHYQCLLRSPQDIIQICPCCKLSQGSNMFIRIHKQPVGRRWCRDLKENKLTLSLSQKEIEKLKGERGVCKEQGEIQYQLRFLKIIRKHKDERQVVVGSSAQTSTRKRFNSITLPKTFIQKLVPNSTFDIGLKLSSSPSMSEQKNEREQLNFFGIFTVQKYSEKQLLQQLFSHLNEGNSVGEEYLREQLGEEEVLWIKMRDANTQKQIEYPVRGDRCSHSQVFDYLSFLEYYKEYGEKLNKKHCPVCEEEVDKCVVDRFLYQRIRDNNQKIREGNSVERGQHKEYQVVRYTKDGGVEFVEDKQEEGMGDDESDENSSEQQGEGMEEDDEDNDSDNDNEEEDESQ